MTEHFNLADISTNINALHTRAMQQLVVQRLLEQTKHIVLAAGEFVDDPLAIVSLFARLQHLVVSGYQRIVLHPSFRYWLQAMRRSVRSSEALRVQEFTRHLADFVWPLEAKHNISFPTTSVLTDAMGGVRCVGLGRFIELGQEYGNTEAEITCSELGAVIRCHDGLTISVPITDLVGTVMPPLPNIEVHGYELTVFDRLAEDRIEFSRRDPWLRVPLTGTNQRQDGTVFFGVSDALYPMEFDRSTIDEGLKVLKDTWPEQYADIAEFTSVIVPLDRRKRIDPKTGEISMAKPDDMVNVAFTVSSRQGAIYLGEATPIPMVENIIHENAHVKLRQMQVIDPLLVNPLDETLRVQVPWRPDPRPIPGVFEGLFVFAHVCEFHRRRMNLDSCEESKERYVTLVSDLQMALAVLKDNALLTALGTDYLASMAAWVRSFD